MPIALLAIHLACAPIPSAAPPARETTVVSALAPVVTATLAAPATTLPPPKKNVTLIVARTDDLKGLDPHKAPTAATWRALELIYDSLFTFDQDLKPIANLAETWKWSDDGKTLSVTLRKNVKFHNGDPLTADDVKFSLERIRDEKTGAVARASLADIDKLETPDATTVVFTLKRANAALPAILASANTAILSKKWIAGGADPATQVVGTGAFKFVSWEAGRALVLAANPNFWIAGLPRIDQLELRVLPDEAAIFAGLTAKTFDVGILSDLRVVNRANPANSALIVTRAPALGFYALQLNATRPTFADVRVRQAIACALDRQEIIDAAFAGEGVLTGAITVPFYRAPLDDLPCVKKDSDKARQLLADAGKMSGVKFKALVVRDEFGAQIAQAQNIQAQLRRVGIETEIETLDPNAYADRWYKGDFDAAILFAGGHPDPDVMLARYWHSTGNLNKLAAYTHPELDRLLDQARAATDLDKRKMLYTQVQTKLAEAAPWVWLSSPHEYCAAQPYVKNFAALANGSLLALRETWVEK